MKKIKNKETRQIRRLAVITLVSFATCAVFGIGMLVYFFAPQNTYSEIVIVPDLIGCDVSEITYSDRIEIEREWIFSRDAENGKVISQEPYAGARRKVAGGQTCHVTVFIGLGEKRDSIPELSGKDQLSAAAILRSMGARVRTVSVYGDGPDGQIIGTSPMQGTKIKTGDAVTLFVSRKRVDAPICVPDFIGMERQDAVTLALSIGLYIGYIDEGEGGDIVTRQSIPEGARVLCGSYISFTVGYDEVQEREWPPVLKEKD
jgi:beta-lactam-binding protein with PASTA domain